MYPVCLEIVDKLCIVVGGGSVAERKVLGLLTAEAQVRVISPRITETLSMLAADGRIEWLARGYEEGDLAGAMLVFAATDSNEVQKAVVQETRGAGQLVNVIDATSDCTFQVPAVVRHQDFTLAVSTGGKSPAVAAMVRRQLEERYGKEYGLLVNLMARLRSLVLSSEADCADRKVLFENILHEDILLWIKTGQWDRLRNHLRTVLGHDVDFDVSQP